MILRLIPRFLRPALKYIYRQEWRIKRVAVTNNLWDAGLPLVSVVIPYYNRADTIDETLDSLKAQTFKNFEVILVNDGSPEQASVDKLQKLDTTSLNYTLINQNNQGVAIARNTGMGKARGKYIMCLDSDDMLDPMYLEKCLIVLESNPQADIVYTDMRLFGVRNEIYNQANFDPYELLHNNMITTAAMFRRECFEVSGGYKPEIGYEDWEYWITLAEKGYWAYRIDEPLFNYRTAASSRYIEDKLKHKLNIDVIKRLHPKYGRNIHKQITAKHFTIKYVYQDQAFINLKNNKEYKPLPKDKKHILFVTPWMTFGGAETLQYNYCKEIKNNFNITFVTTSKSAHEWEYKFKEITDRIYHLANIIEDRDILLEFLTNYVTSHEVDIIHMVHTDSVLDLLPKLKARHPHLKVVLTLFNDRVPTYMSGAVSSQQFIDRFVTDNSKVAATLSRDLGNDANISVIPNGIDIYSEYNPKLFNSIHERKSLNILEKDVAVFFVGRLSIEKNPDVFIDVARSTLGKYKTGVKFFIIGDGPMRQEIEKRLKKLNKGNIEYLGYQSEVSRFLSAADVFILPSAVEGFPLSILEAMAMNVAVISSDVGAVSEVLNDGKDGFVVKPGSADEIVERLDQLITDRSQLEKVKSLGRQKVEKKYSNKILGENYKELYKGLL